MYLIENQADRKKSNIFSICQATWDTNRKKFYGMNKADELKCCFDRCDEPIKNCKKFCENTLKNDEDKQACNVICVKQKVLCEDNCKAYLDWEQNPLVICAKKSKCFKDNFTFDSDCVGKNRENLINCCKNSCIQSDDYDCNDLCEFSTDILQSLETRVFKKTDKTTMNSLNPQKYKRKFIVIIIIAIIFIAIFLFKKLTKHG
jgi:hypothetical protein